MPFFWDEVGQFIPAALDLYREGRIVPHAELASIHPPGLSAFLASVWHVFGFSILKTRIVMLAIASLGVLLSFLLAIRLSRGSTGAPALTAVLFLIATPLFYTQAMLAQLDMPVMVFTALALLLFLDGRFGLCAVACVGAVLVKETAINTPIVFSAWLWFKEKKRREALYFLAPMLALAAWIVLLWNSTGHVLGNPAFVQYNFFDALRPGHILLALGRRIYFLFVSDGRWIGTIAIYIGWRFLRTRDWQIAGLIALAQTLVVTFFGGATLERYLLPVLPILYAAVALATSTYRRKWHWAVQAAMFLSLFIGWFWEPWHAFPRENNLAMIDFVHLHQQAAEFLSANEQDKKVVTTWPLSEELRRPEFGYVVRPFAVRTLASFEPAQVPKFSRDQTDLLIVYSRPGPFDGLPLAKWSGWRAPASVSQVREVGYVPILRMEQRDEWIEIYSRNF